MNNEQTEQIINLLSRIAQKLDYIDTNTEMLHKLRTEVEDIKYYVRQIKDNTD